MVACMVENQWKKRGIVNACKSLRLHILEDMSLDKLVVINHKTFKKSGCKEALTYQDILVLLLQIQNGVEKHNEDGEQIDMDSFGDKIR